MTLGYSPFSTPQLRKNIYQHVLNHLKSYRPDEAFFVCHELQKYLILAGIPLSISSSADIAQFFPEFYRQKPLTILLEDRSWWQQWDHQSRIIALENAIKLCDEK